MPLFNTNTLVQTVSSSLASNVTTNSGTFSTLLTINLTTYGGSLVVKGFVTSSNSGTPDTNLFRIQINGTTVATAADGTDGGVGSGANIQLDCHLLSQNSVTAGSNTITLQWAVTGGTGRINALSGTNGEQAILHAKEVYV